MIITSHFQVSRLPNRVKEVRFPGVDGLSTVNMGSNLYQITQTGEADISPTESGGNYNAYRDLMFAGQPGVFSGATPITIDTRGQGVYQNCRLVDVQAERVSRRIVKYKYVWQQMEAGGDLGWPS